jgi:alkanesulfonate monooxygenase SsuD/methylene tetrahydromethanopterin reductase-like flavin-dependent oxidoreductase (luciferase family)
VITYGIGFSGDTFSARDCVDVAVEMDRAGMDAIWLGEVFFDVFTIYGALARETTRLRLPVSIATWARTPPLMGVSFSTLDGLAPGRAILGLGTMPKARNEQHHGISYERPVARMREYLILMRLLWGAHSGNRVSFEGSFYRIHDYERWGPPESPALKVYLAAVGPKMLELSGELADGVILHPTHSHRSYAELTFPALRRGLARRDPALGPLEVVGSFECVIDNDRRRAVERARRGIMFYFRTPYIADVMALHGFSAEQAAIRSALDRGDGDAAARMVTDEMVRELAIVGDADDVQREVARYDGMVDSAAFAVPTAGVAAAEVRESIRAILRVFGKEGSP